jgi:phosphoglycerate dehydrogenase-like enzyme
MASTDAPSNEAPLKMAILDDNLSLSAAHFAHIPASRVSITVFTDTLPPYSHPSTSASSRAALVARLHPFSILSTMRERTPLPGALLDRLPNLKLILVTGARHHAFDPDDVRARGIAVAAALGRGRAGSKAAPPAADLSNGAAHPTTQQTWALILGLARGVAREHADLRAGGWQSRGAVGLRGRTLGILGLGRLGGPVARVGALAFGMRVVCWSANLTQEKADAEAQRLGLPVEMDGEKVFKVVSKEDVFRQADVVSLHYTLSERSRGMVGAADLALMKPDAMLVNTSRGPLIVEEDLIETLQKGKIMGAALDTFDVEPLPVDHPFRTVEWGTEGRSELLLSPHMGYVERETLDAFYAETAENLERYLDGKELLNRIV